MRFMSAGHCARYLTRIQERLPDLFEETAKDVRDYIDSIFEDETLPIYNLSNKWVDQRRRLIEKGLASRGTLGDDHNLKFTGAMQSDIVTDVSGGMFRQHTYLANVRPSEDERSSILREGGTYVSAVVMPGSKRYSSAVMKIGFGGKAQAYNGSDLPDVYEGISRLKNSDLLTSSELLDGYGRTILEGFTSALRRFR